MANKTLFKSSKTEPKVKVNPKKWVESVNEAGGAAFSFPDKMALAQFAVTGTFNNTFYADAESQLEKVKELAVKVDSVFLAKLAVYSHQSGYMKDAPAFLLAVLHSRGESQLLASVFNRVITTFKMLSNFVQIVRSGVTGRKSFGTATKKLIANWLDNKKAQEVFNGSIGLSNPSVADIIKMVHPKAGDRWKDAVYAYVTEARGWEEKAHSLPADIQEFELMKKGELSGVGGHVPNIPFRALTNIQLSTEQWRTIARNMPFNTLRQNLNMLNEREVFKSDTFIREVVAKLTSVEDIRKAKVFPYQLFTTYLNTTGLPTEITNALQDAAEIATENVPAFEGKTALLIDVSGSMQSPITGHRGYGVPSSKMRCVDVAGLMASCVLRQNKNARVVLFDTRTHEAKLNPRDSIMTNAAAIARFGGGGTDLSQPLALLNREGARFDNLIYVSDNESWAGSRYGTALEFNRYQNRVPNVKLVNIDIQPYAHSQVPDSKNVLNIGGFSDVIWLTIANFVSRKDGIDFVTTIEKSVELG